jgi:hypothetical protein
MAFFPMFGAVKQALDGEDIEGLRALGCPPDEYDSEAASIAELIAKHTNSGASPSAQTVAAIIEQVWQEMFGPLPEEEICLRRPAFSRVAERLTTGNWQPTGN